MIILHNINVQYNSHRAQKKTAMLTCKITLPDSPHPVIISTNPGFQTFYLARQKWIPFFRLINTKKYCFSFLAVGFCPKNNGVCQSLGGCSPSPLARTPTFIQSESRAVASLSEGPLRSTKHLLRLPFLLCHSLPSSLQPRSGPLWSYLTPHQISAEPGHQTIFAVLWPQKKTIRAWPNLSYLPWTLTQ